jgi:predicted nucleotidyltransferase
MRLTPAQIDVLRRTAARRFGAGAGLWVFGSRVRDELRGGDVDLYIESPDADADRLITCRLRFLADLHDTPEFEGERIDVVVNSPLNRDQLPIHRIARAEGIRL